MSDDALDEEIDLDPEKLAKLDPLAADPLEVDPLADIEDLVDPALIEEDLY